MDTPCWLTDADLSAPVQALLGAPVDRIERWAAAQLSGGSGEAPGVWRVIGEGQ